MSLFLRRGAPLILAAALSPLAACEVGPSYTRPDVTLTSTYVAPNAAASSAVAAPLDTWWDGFHDAELSRVVARAESQNLDIEQARDRVLQSRALVRAASAALLPQVNGSGSAAAVRQSLLGPIGSIGTHLPGFQRDIDDYTLGGAASWELDLFGGLRREHEAARADAEAAADEAVAIRTAVAGETADAYLQVRGLQARIAVAERQRAVEQDLVGLLEQRVGQGVSPDRESREARAELEGVNADIPPLNAALTAQLDRLDVLMGAQAGTYRAELSTPGPTPAPPVLAAGDGPSDLLRRRPDVLAAERRVAAANARIGAAIADYYPKVSISGLLGVDSLNATQLFTGSAVAHQIAGGFSWRLFDFGRIDAEVAQARGHDAETLAAYRATVYRATQEVEDAVSNLAQQERRAEALQSQIDQLSVARGQAEQAYEGGVTSLIEVRDTDRELLAASDQLAQTRADAARDAVTAFRALGGGWKPDAPVLARR